MREDVNVVLKRKKKEWAWGFATHVEMGDIFRGLDLGSKLNNIWR